MATAPDQPVNFPDMINKIQTKINSLGQGPHSDQEKEEIKNLQLILAKAQQENMKTPLQPGAQVQYQVMAQPSVIPAKGEVKLEPSTSTTGATASPSSHKILDRKRLQDLVKEIDPMTQLEDDVEEVLMLIADDFIENVVNASCDIAKHRRSDTLEVKDVQLYLDRAWNMWIPGFGSDEIRPYKRAPATEAHRQRMALIKKTLKKS